MARLAGEAGGGGGGSSLDHATWTQGGSIIDNRARRCRVVAIALTAFLGALWPASVAAARSFTVNSTADPGHGGCKRSECTLREAIAAANHRPGTDVVRFRIGHGHKTIEPVHSLPAITGNAKLNGWSQPGFRRAPLIELRGSSAGPGASGLVIAGPAVTIRGLVITRFAGSGVDVGGAVLSGRARIQGTYIGTDPSGRRDWGNAGNGVIVNYLAGVTIGGGTPRQRVVISGNGGDGVRLEQGDTGGSASSIVGSRIGTNAAGTAALPNHGDGIHWSYPWGARIGGPDAGPSDNRNNLISGNDGVGIALVSNCLPICDARNVIEGNRVGTNLAGSAALPNADQGVYLGDTSDTAIGDDVGNLISGNGAAGVFIQGAAHASLRGNAIGTNTSVNRVIPNHGDGVHLTSGPGGIEVGGSENSESNVIGGNSGDGIFVGSANTQIYHNYVGVRPGGTDLGNSGNGIEVAGEALVGGTGPFQKGNEIAFNNGAGIGVSSGVSGISANSIHDNGGLGIDVGDDGPTPNDPLDSDGGPNFLQNGPVITSVISSGFSTDVSVDLDSVAGTAMSPHPFSIELFSNPPGTCDPAGGEGAKYLGSVALTTGAGGHGSAMLSLPVLPAGTELAATATDASDVFPWTSEFSGCATVPSS